MLTDEMAQVNRIIVDRMQSPVALIPQLAGYIVAAGGKRLRPLLTLASARLCGYAGSRHHKLAAAVEFIHTATLLHDDVVDESERRRGQHSANALFGNQASVLVGDFLFSRSFELMVEDGSIDVLRILSRASAIIAEGEVMQLATSNNLDTSEAEYLAVVTAKTAALFAAACEIGAVVADRPTSDAEALHAFGLNFGIAFQIVDDVLDYSAREALLGKTVGDDFREGKLTLPVVYAIERGNDIERAFWRRTLEQSVQREGDLEHATALIARHRGFVSALELARAHGGRARAALKSLPTSPLRTTLDALVEFCLDREF
ncbi:MAG TPA: polyprenyl synthetase family protein [Alphaproteobacteria bacterium]|nr:polyprenyl synthetase family protein [Alphaproteobacteria bacterium]